MIRRRWLSTISMRPWLFISSICLQGRKWLPSFTPRSSTTGTESSRWPSSISKGTLLCLRKRYTERSRPAFRDREMQEIGCVGSAMIRVSNRHRRSLPELSERKKLKKQELERRRIAKRPRNRGKETNPTIEEGVYVRRARSDNVAKGWRIRSVNVRTGRRARSDIERAESRKLLRPSANVRRKERDQSWRTKSIIRKHLLIPSANLRRKDENFGWQWQKRSVRG